MDDAQLEAVAFALKPGQISEVVSVANMYYILKCEEIMPQQFLSSQQLAEQDRPQPAPLPVVLHDERDLDGTSLVGGLVASYPDQLTRGAGAGFYDEWKGKFGPSAWNVLEKAVGNLS